MYPIYQKDLDKLNKYIKKDNYNIKKYKKDNNYIYLIKNQNESLRLDQLQLLNWVKKKYPQCLHLVTDNKYYNEIDKWLTRWESGFEDSFEIHSMIIDKITWAYKYHHITKEEMNVLSDRMIKILEEE